MGRKNKFTYRDLGPAVRGHLQVVHGHLLVVEHRHLEPVDAVFHLVEEDLHANLLGESLARQLTAVFDVKLALLELVGGAFGAAGLAGRPGGPPKLDLDSVFWSRDLFLQELLSRRSVVLAAQDGVQLLLHLLVALFLTGVGRGLLLLLPLLWRGRLLGLLTTAAAATAATTGAAAGVLASVLVLLLLLLLVIFSGPFPTGGPLCLLLVVLRLARRALLGHRILKEK